MKNRLRIAITGGESQLAKEFINNYENDLEIGKFSRSELDITNLDEVKNKILINSFDVVLNCAAYNYVDDAEDNNEENYKVNAWGPKLLASVCNQRKIKLVHISTDYAFASEKPIYFEKSREVNPCNAYGKAKVEGENQLLEFRDLNCLIIRTSWLYGQFGGKFFTNMISMAKEKKAVRIVNDQFGQPTWTLKLSKYIYHKIMNNEYDGLNHMTGFGIASRFEFAREIYKLMGTNPNLVQPISSMEYQTKAKRPSYSLLQPDNIEGIVGKQNWRDDLRNIIEKVEK